jgi:hypothetical protein
MGYTNPSFLDTKEEHDKWHKGLYKGLRIQRPDKLGKALHIHGKGWREWYSSDDHYHDFAVLGAYGVKAASVVAGLKALAALGL